LLEKLKSRSYNKNFVILVLIRQQGVTDLRTPLR